MPVSATGHRGAGPGSGGGLVPGCLGLIGGDPGIGKSTLLLQVASSVARRGGKVLYVTGEESLAQLKLRAVRLGARGRKSCCRKRGRYRTASARIIEEEKPLLVIVDSIQTMYVQEVASPPGSVGQVREVCRPLSAAGQGRRHRHSACGPCDQRRQFGRSEGTGTCRGFRLVFRRRCTYIFPHHQVREEQVRLHQRSGHL